MLKNKIVGVVIPSFRVKELISDVIDLMPEFVDHIYVVDDCCDQNTGGFVAQKYANDDRVRVIFHKENKGVGGAVITGYRQSILDGCDIVSKIDGDGQMSPKILEKFLLPIINEDADYTKGNRFFNLTDLTDMPRLRLFGNFVLSFLTKLSSGYWKVFDPTNGYTAINVKVLRFIPLEKLSERYFFESDMLFRLGVVSAKVSDIPMKAVYGDEVSNLKIHRILMPFLKGNLRNLGKRIFYKYFLQDFNAASLELVMGVILSFSGVLYGLINWHKYASLEQHTPTGTIMIAMLLCIMGFQLLLSFLYYDISNSPENPISNLIEEPRE